MTMTVSSSSLSPPTKRQSLQHHHSNNTNNGDVEVTSAQQQEQRDGAVNDDYDNEIPPPIVLSPTADTLDTAEEANYEHYDDENDNHTTGTTRRPKKVSSSSSTSPLSQQQQHKPSYSVQDHYWETIVYISASAILGSVVRSFLERIFGEDCEKYDWSYVVDFLTPVTKHICVTVSGRTEQTGGALFYDLPANMLGCFVMGLITPRPQQKQQQDQQQQQNHHRHRPSSHTTRIPWLHVSHPLQQDDVYHSSIGTGFCGCLTTFASWNTQMVVMLDGSHTVLGSPSQLLTVFFGYTIGLLTSIMSFYIGRQVGVCLYLWKHPEEQQQQYDDDDNDEERQKLTTMTTNSNKVVDNGTPASEEDPKMSVMNKNNPGSYNDDSNGGIEVSMNTTTNEFDNSIIDRRRQPHSQSRSQQHPSDLSRIGEDNVVDDNDETLEAQQRRRRHHHLVHKLPLIVLSIGFLIAFGIAGIQQNIEWYKGMMLLWITSPIGALIRWKLATWNVVSNRPSYGCSLVRFLPDWIPMGTLVCNVVASMIGCLVTGLDDRYYDTSGPWIRGLLFAINTGMAGSMSTVSTMIKETVTLAEQTMMTTSSSTTTTGNGGTRGGSLLLRLLFRPYKYSIGTCLVAMILGLCVYSTTVRI